VIHGEDVMNCALYAETGELLAEGTCTTVAGLIEMHADRWMATPREGAAGLTLIGPDGGHALVRVDGVRVLDSDADRGPREVYRLSVLPAHD
jgi:hypothetical protein